MGWMRAAAAAIVDALTPPRPLVFDDEPDHTFDSAPRPVDRVITEMMSGTGKVSRDDALTVAAVQRGRNEICALATIPLQLYRGTAIVDSPLFRQFDLDVPNVVHMAQTVEDLLFESIAWWRVVGTDFDGYPVAVQRVSPDRVSLKPPKGNPTPALSPGGIDKSGPYVWVDGEAVPSRFMIRFDSPNPGLLKACGRPIRKAIMLDQLASVYASNPRPLDYFTDNPDYTGEAEYFDDDQVGAFLQEWRAARRAQGTGWVPGQVKRMDVNAPSPAELQLVELQKQAAIEIANGIGVDPEDLGVSTTSRTYQNEDARRRDKINRMMGPYMRAITDRLSMGDVTRRGYAARFDLVDYLKPDPAARTAYYQAMRDLVGITPEYIAAQEGIPMTALGPVPAPAPAPALPAGRENTARPPIQLGDVTPSRTFDAGDTGHRFALADFGDAPAATVNAQTRTITGLAVPYGKISTAKFGRRYRFAPGSLEYSSPDRMAHLIDHGTPVGFHRKITHTKDGPVVELAVLDGPEGSPAKAQRDQLLYDAEHGLYSGLSIGVAFSDYPEDGDVVYNEADDVWDVVRATWRETSTTYMPSFDDARVTKVAASLTGGQMDPCPHCAHRHAENIACATFRAQLLNQPTPAPTPGPAPSPNPPAPAPAPVPTPPGGDQAQFAAFLEWQRQHGGGAAPAGPTAVNPHHSPAQVTEPDPYRFDARGDLLRGSHDFSSDIVDGTHPEGNFDKAARDRVNAFIKKAFSDPEMLAKFAVTPTNVAGLNPNRQRPDLYVDQMEYQYPLWESIQKGPLQDVTPFVVPKYNSSSGLVADHVTGTEPTPGAFSVTTQTITPSPVSGKLEITREAFDQGGNPQMSGLLWRQMTRGWYEALEAYAQAQFTANAASIADLTITTAAVDAALDASIADALVPLRYIRGGFRFRKAFTQVDLYKALAKAKDSAGAPLYPVYGPMNRAGQADDDFGVIHARGIDWIPAWATAATGTVAASSWMFDPEGVAGWASNPERLDIVWRVAWVDMGLWGYKAFALLDANKVREVVYDPV